MKGKLFSSKYNIFTLLICIHLYHWEYNCILQPSTLQEITADTGIEIPDVSVAKQLMRKHVRNLLSILGQRERQIIRLRFGIEGGNHKSLSEIGNIYGLSKERVRQIESRALYKLRQCLGSHGLDAYADLLL